MAVTLEQVSKRYGRRRPWVVQHVDLELPAGSVTLLSGPNGSGKSTMLRVIAGLTMPTRGSVQGRPPRVAVVPDHFVPPVRMTARSYLWHHARIRGMTAERAVQRAGELGETLGVAPGLDVEMQYLSKGNVQKIALGQAFLAPVDLLVLDEPRTALDSRAAAALDELLLSASGRGTTVALSDPTPGVAYQGACRYEIAAGHVQPLDATPARRRYVTIRLRPALSAPSRAARFDHPLVVHSESDGKDILIDVGPENSDEVLLAALSDGWSVLDVRSAGPAPTGRTSP